MAKRPAVQTTRTAYLDWDVCGGNCHASVQSSLDGLDSFILKAGDLDVSTQFQGLEASVSTVLR